MVNFSKIDFSNSSRILLRDLKIWNQRPRKPEIFVFASKFLFSLQFFLGPKSWFCIRYLFKTLVKHLPTPFFSLFLSNCRTNHFCQIKFSKHLPATFLNLFLDDDCRINFVKDDFCQVITNIYYIYHGSSFRFIRIEEQILQK